MVVYGSWFNKSRLLLLSLIGYTMDMRIHAYSAVCTAAWLQTVYSDYFLINIKITPWLVSFQHMTDY